MYIKNRVYINLDSEYLFKGLAILMILILKINFNRFLAVFDRSNDWTIKVYRNLLNKII